MEECYEKRESIPAEHTAFPSPFIKEIVQFLDGKALEDTKKFFAISKTVKARKEYFPPNAEVEVVYPPSALPYFENNQPEDYLFTISRLDGAKRIDMIVEAMKYVKGNVKLKIAGTGPDEAKLKEMAKNDSRIEFLGFVNDEEAIKYYSKAKGVIFIPYEEDYGLVTIEAMMSHRPVVTCYDSGGTTEFVKEGQTGFIAASNPKVLGESIQKLCDLSNDELIEMGNRCYEKVESINWETVAKALTASEIVSHGVPVRKGNGKKLVLTSTFAIHPAQGGGQVRTYELMKHLANTYDVEIVSLCNHDMAYKHKTIAPNVIETSVPRSAKHYEKDYDLEMQIGVHVADIGAALFVKETPEYEKRLKKALENTELAIISHPFLIEAFRRCHKDMPFIYDAQDVEYLIKKELLSKSTHKKADELVQKVYELEKYCCEQSQMIMTCSEEDKQSIIKCYGVSKDKVIVVPNGVDTSATKYTSLIQRQSNKARKGLAKQKVGMFMGSWHPPNLEACEQIIQIAEECPDTTFLLVGSQCLYFKDRVLPDNVGLMGLVSEKVKNDIFETVDFALNPMLSGSGTNLKMFDYMAAGIPIITTAFGTRGIANKECFIVKEIEEMTETIKNFDLKHCTIPLEEVRQYVEDTFSWREIVNKLEKSI